MAKDGVGTDLSDIFLILGLEPITIACVLITFRHSLLLSRHCFKESKSLLRVSLSSSIFLTFGVEYRDGDMFHSFYVLHHMCEGIQRLVDFINSCSSLAIQ